jgi:hypothetical protein
MTERLTDEALNALTLIDGSIGAMARELLAHRRATPADDLRAAGSLSWALPAEGDTIDRMRVMLWSTPEGRALINRGDAKLYWLNEGDVTTAIMSAALSQNGGAA